MPPVMSIAGNENRLALVKFTQLLDSGPADGSQADRNDREKEADPHV